MTLRLFGEVLVTMLVILDPPGNVPIFLAVTRQLSDKERHRAAFLAIGTAFLVIVLKTQHDAVLCQRVDA